MTPIDRFEAMAVSQPIDSTIQSQSQGSSPDLLSELINKGEQALYDKDIKSLIHIGDELERIGSLSKAAYYLAEAGRLKMPSPFPEWNGQILTGKSVLIIQRIRHIAAPIRMAPLIGIVCKEATRCVVVVPARLKSLFHRSYPRAEVYDSYSPCHDEFDYIASFESLASQYCIDMVTYHHLRTPLIPDRSNKERLYLNYHKDEKKVIGISWASTNSRKDLPSISDFRNCLNNYPFHYISLQYGDVSSDIAELISRSTMKLTFDPIDALEDLDLFAAQVAATDFVISISNTTVHMAGALDIPCFVLLDDKYHLSWPATGDSSPWYPKLKIFRKLGRPWPLVISEALESVWELGDNEFIV